MKIRLLLLACLFATTLSAQNWCPPGALWKHSMYGFQCSGYSELIYVGDTLIQSKTCKKINHRFLGYNPMFAPTGTVNVSIANHFTYESNKVVYYYNINSQFDTLFNFNANIGDVWLRVVSPHGGICNVLPRKPVEVLDTGSVILNSVQLKKLVLKYTNVYMSTFTTTVIDTVYEKIGSKKNFLFPFVCEGAIVDPDILAGGAFRCYFDNSFGNYNVTTNCNYINSVEENYFIAQPLLVMFPNPTTDYLAFSSNQEIVSVRVTDVLGKEYSVRLLDERIDVSKLSSGIYFLHTTNKSERSVTGKFIKE